MSDQPRQSVRVFAPAKINLYLHVNEKLANGYHGLDSLVDFADVGDSVSIEAADVFAFHVEGPFAGAFSGSDLDATPTSSNLVVRAAWAMARASGHRLDFKITLTKNLPLGAGIGGGSADAAAVIWGLLQYWGLPKDAPYLHDLMVELGADVPVCFWSRAVRMRGIGDVFDEVPPLPEMPILLVHPGKSASTPSVFGLYESGLRERVAIPEFENETRLIRFLWGQDNDLSEAAQSVVPDIRNVLQVIGAQNGCALARMSGAGSCCFGLFNDESAMENAFKIVKGDNPDWWVQKAWLGRTARY
jgi:4-diphosphocytidyl-2-C-methyl-D-erythritol kinase